MEISHVFSYYNRAVPFSPRFNKRIRKIYTNLRILNY